MPGINGIISAAQGRRDQVSRMTRSLAHEPFYVTGVHDFDAVNLSVGWTALPNSPSASLPFWNETSDVCLIFSGENFMSSQDIIACGLKQANSKASLGQSLIGLYELQGIDFLEKLNGWFCGILLDFRNAHVFLFNDRYGLGRIYYHQAPEGFYFSSEAKSILAILPKLRNIDLRGVAEFVTCGCVLQNRTLFQGVSLLPAGSKWGFCKERVTKESYFDPGTWERQSKLGVDQFYDALRETFVRSLPKYFAGPSPIGMSLTGGLDSRLIMAWSGQQPGALPCYSFGGPYRDCADVEIGRRVAAFCGQRHEVISVGESFLTEFPTLAEKSVYVSDGAMDVTGAVELYVNRIARQFAPVRMTGNYGSEIMRSNVAFRPRRIRDELLAEDFLAMTYEASRTYNTERDTHVLSFIAFKQTAWHHYARLSVEQSQLTLRSPYLDNDLVRIMYRAPQEALDGVAVAMRLIHDGNPSLAKLPTDRGVNYDSPLVIGRLRALFAEFIVRAEYACDYGLPQSFCKFDKWLMPLHLERLFLGRHKFYHFRTWYRDHFSSYLRDTLLTQRAKQRPYLSGRALERLVDEHSSGAGN